MIDSIVHVLSSGLGRAIPVVDYMTDSIAGVQQYLAQFIPNLVIIYAESEVLPVEILPLLDEINGDTTQITVLGLPEWDKFEHLENDYLINLKTYLFCSYFVDYYEPSVKHFIRAFRSRYLAEPLEYAYDGFDISYFFLSALMDYGRDFPGCTPGADYPLLHTQFRFRGVQSGGLENTYWNIYYYQDYDKIQIAVPEMK